MVQCDISRADVCWEATRQRHGGGARRMVTGLEGRAPRAWRRMGIVGQQPCSKRPASTNPTCGAYPPTIYHELKVVGRLGALERNGQRAPTKHQVSRLYLHNSWRTPTYNISRAGGCWYDEWRRRGSGSGAWRMIVGLGGGHGGLGGKWPQSTNQAASTAPVLT